jgi:hypothetical protein
VAFDGRSKLFSCGLPKVIQLMTSLFAVSSQLFALSVILSREDLIQ